MAVSVFRQIIEQSEFSCLYCEILAQLRARHVAASAVMRVSPTRWRMSAGTRIAGRMCRASISLFILSMATAAEGLALSRSRRAKMRRGARSRRRIAVR